MPGAGKSTVAKAASRLGFTVLNLGDVVRTATVQRRLATSDVNLGTVMQALRHEQGAGAIAQLALSRFHGEADWVVVDGVRSIAEVDAFRKLGPTKILGVHAAPRVRYGFLRRRARGDAPLAWGSFVVRDRRELAVGVGETLALSDEILSNNEITRSTLQAQAKHLLQRWMAAVEAG
jgi:dephospho-CoA kinase